MSETEGQATGATVSPELGAFAEPEQPVRAPFLATITLANIGILMVFFTPLQNLLPRYAELAVGADGKERALAWISAGAALAAILANPLAGALSDLTTGRWGRRRPWILCGTLFSAAALVLMAWQTSVVGLAIAWTLVLIGSNAAFAGVTALIPDQVPVRQRGVVSGLVGMAQVLGVVAGLVVVSYVVTDLHAGTVAVGVLIVLLAIPLLLVVRDAPLDAAHRPDWHLGTFVRKFWISPREHPDFAWAWITRFLMWLGTSLATIYLLYFLKDHVHYANPEQGVTMLTGLYGLGTILTAVVGGRLSDRSGKRKIYVIWASLVMALACLILAASTTFTMAAVAAIVLGMGYGVYLAVDQALVTQVLPAAVDRARDLGVINIANAAPQVIAPLIAAVLVTSLGGYPTLYIVTAIVTAVSGILVRKIKSVP
jgi:MFS family permease